MKKIIAILLGALLIGTLGAAVVNAVASDDAGTGYGYGHMRMWAARNGGAGYGAGYGPGYGPGNCPVYDSYCPYASTDETVELEVETADEAFEIAKKKIDSGVSEDDIYQMGRWWVVFYENEDGVYKQARIDAVTGDVFTDYNVPAEPQAGGRYARGTGYCRAYGY
ncbi:hypothetical protein FTO70_13410 [Methanosarcina sp. KYL-1]|uniref:hypothetical protein n=1 Tax=Methanosarcina sp. KYL-1 TaxID=2602068 RepID=UPI0021006A7A|nr:hypothetical protein [Methanosarcina sp. KYL-1]MCQ1536648.1 hypothetical protein [Methanosarcina sp. KYL-1]